MSTLKYSVSTATQIFYEHPHNQIITQQQQQQQSAKSASTVTQTR